jgi:hypothetical protein
VIEYGDRTRSLPAPPPVVWDDLVARKSRGTRAWVRLRDGEVRPEVVESVRPTLLVWSSLWATRPDDLVRLTLAPQGRFGTALRFVLLAGGGDTPDEVLTRHLRQRVNELLYRDLRESYGQ